MKTAPCMLPRLASATAAFALLASLFLTTSSRAAGNDQARELEDARDSFRSLFTVPDSAVPDRLLSDCKCVAVFPGVIRGAFVIGGRRGHGVISCRDSSGQWSAPSFLTLTGGSYGLQIGVEKTQLVLFFMDEASARALLSNRFTLGAKAGVAAGPIGRSAEASTDLKLNSTIYSYARSKGAFAGISIEGAKVAPDTKAIRDFYGRKLSPEKILFENGAPVTPPAAQAFLDALPKPAGK